MRFTRVRCRQRIRFQEECVAYYLGWGCRGENMVYPVYARLIGRGSGMARTCQGILVTEK